MLLHVLIATALVGNAFGQGVSCPPAFGYRTMAGVNIGGLDIRCVNDNTYVKPFWRNCMADPSCMAFSIDTATNKGCLKSGSTPVVINKDACTYVKVMEVCPSIAGYKAAVNTDHRGGDISCAPLQDNVDNGKVAAGLCNANPLCLGFNLDYDNMNQGELKMCLKKKLSAQKFNNHVCFYTKV